MPVSGFGKRDIDVRVDDRVRPLHHARFDLRSRCLLWPTDTMKWELLEVPGKAPTEFTITAADAIKLLAEAVAAAEKLGLFWQKEPVKLTPSPNLIALLKRSQDISAKTPADAAGE